MSPPLHHSIANPQAQALDLQITCPAWTQGKTTLGPFTLSLSGAERIAILGCSGAGKSSLLRSIAGDNPAQRGYILLQQKKLSAYPLAQLACRRAVLAQATEVAFPLSVDLLIGLGRVARQPDPDLAAIVAAAAAAASASHLLGRTYSQLSGGEKARVQLARIFAQLWDQQHGLILLDEPLSALDPGLQVELLESLQNYASQRAHAIIAVLHDVNQAMHYFERYWLMRDGQLLADLRNDEAILPYLEQIYGLAWQVLSSPDGQRIYSCARPRGKPQSSPQLRLA